MFFVKIDMEMLTKSYKKKCFLRIRENWKTIKNLQEHVKEIYKLRKVEFTNANDYFIPSCEPIDIIQRDQPMQLKAVGIKPQEKEQTNNKDLLIPSKNIDSIELEKRPRKKMFNPFSYNAVAPPPSDDTIIPTTKKRKRCKKNKNDTADMVEAEAPKNQIIKKSKIDNSSTNLNGCHLKFDEDGNPIKDIEEEHFQAKFMNCIDKLDNTKPRMFYPTVIRNSIQTKELNSKDSSNKISENDKKKIIIKENKIICSGLEILKTKLGTNKININDDSDTIGDSIEEKSKGNNKCLSIETILSSASPLKGDLQINDVFLFKIYRLNESYEPSLSDYICGTVEQISNENDENYLNIFINDGHEQLKDPLGKFSLPSTDDDYSKDYLKIKLCELYDLQVYVKD